MTGTIATRLAEAIASRGMDMKSASLAAGLGETYARDVIKRGLNPTASALVKLAAALSVRAEWLLTGDGSIDSARHDGFDDVAAVWRLLSAEKRQAILRLMQMLSEEGISHPADAAS